MTRCIKLEIDERMAALLYEKEKERKVYFEDKRREIIKQLAATNPVDKPVDLDPEYLKSRELRDILRELSDAGYETEIVDFHLFWFCGPRLSLLFITKIDNSPIALEMRKPLVTNDTDSNETKK